MNLDVSIVIVSFSTAKLTKQCLDSIYAADLIFGFEIIVVDNNSGDESVSMIKNNFPEVKIIENKENNYFAKANNQGVKIANGEYILLLNSDTIVLKGELEKLLDFIENADKKIVCVGGTILNMDYSHQSAGYPFPSIWERFTMVFKLNRIIKPKLLARYVLPLGTPLVDDQNHEVGWISGCCMLIKKDTYLSLDGLNEDLEFYGEEPEFSWRLKKNGYQTWVIPDTKIIHLGGGSSNIGFSSHLRNLDKKLYRYSQLQKYTVGYSKAINMSKVVIAAAYIKWYLTFDKQKKNYLRNAISYEKKVVKYLETCIKNNG